MSKRRGAISFEDLSGAQKASVLLMMLGSEEAGRVMTNLEPAEIERLTTEIASLEEVPSSVTEAILKEFESLHVALGGVLPRGRDFAFEALAKAIGAQRAEEVFERVQSSGQPTGFEILKDIDRRQLLSFIRQEHPQTVALILAHLRPRQAASLLAALDEELQIAVVSRLATMESVAPEMVQEVKENLSHLFRGWQRGQAEAVGGIETAAEVLNLLDRAVEKKILLGLEADDAGLAARVKNLLFTFEDMLKLTNNDLRQILKEIDSNTLALALKVASDELKEKIYGNISQRAREMLQDEIEFMGPVRLKAVEEAQALVTESVLRLDEAGQIAIARGAEGEELVA